MYLKIYLIVTALAFIFQLRSPLISGTFIATATPRTGPTAIPYLVKLSPQRKIIINSVKPMSFCGDVFLAKDTSYPIDEDTHVYICHKDNIWNMEIGFRYHNDNKENANGFTFETNVNVYGLTIVLDDDSNSLAVLQDDSYVIFNHTVSRSIIDFRSYQWYAFSGKAEWNVVTYES